MFEDQGNPGLAQDEAVDFNWDSNSAHSSDDMVVNDEVFNDLQLFFHAIELPHLIDGFLKHKVTLGQLLEFDEQDLINCGVDCVGERKKILQNTVQMHCEKWQPSSLHDMTEKSLLSSPGIYVTLNDINKHLEYIGVTAKYITRRLQMEPKILELGKDYIGIAKVKSEVDDIMVTSKTMQSRLLTLRKELDKHKNDLTLRPAYDQEAKNWQIARLADRVMTMLITGFVVTVSIKFGWRFLTKFHYQSRNLF